MKSRLRLIVSTFAVIVGVYCAALPAQQAPATAPRDFWIYAWHTPKVDGS